MKINIVEFIGDRRLEKILSDLGTNLFLPGNERRVFFQKKYPIILSQND